MFRRRRRRRTALGLFGLLVLHVVVFLIILAEVKASCISVSLSGTIQARGSDFSVRVGSTGKTTYFSRWNIVSVCHCHDVT